GAVCGGPARPERTSRRAANPIAAPMTLLQLAINGVALGAAYALSALGFVFIVNATGAVNFAHGDLVMAGGYVAVGLGAMAPLPMIVLLPVAGAVMFVG